MADGNEMKFEHPSYGVIVLTRLSGGSGTLFDSPVKHDHRIRIEIREAVRYRSISNDWIHPSKTIVDFEMSETQFARFITSSGLGSGTPITIRRKGGESIPAAPFERKGEEFKQEIAVLQKQASDGIEKLEKRIDELLVKKDKLTKEEKSELRALVFDITRKVRNSIPWVVDQFHEKMHKTVEEAKGEIEGFLKEQARILGMKALADRVSVEAPMSLASGACQHELPEDERSTCRHGLFFGTSCEDCIRECLGCATMMKRLPSSDG